MQWKCHKQSKLGEITQKRPWFVKTLERRKPCGYLVLFCFRRCLDDNSSCIPRDECVCARACSPSSKKTNIRIYKAAMRVCTTGSVDTRKNYGASLSHTQFLYLSISQREGREEWWDNQDKHICNSSTNFRLVKIRTKRGQLYGSYLNFVELALDFERVCFSFSSPCRAPSNTCLTPSPRH